MNVAIHPVTVLNSHHSAVDMRKCCTVSCGSECAGAAGWLCDRPVSLDCNEVGSFCLDQSPADGSSNTIEPDIAQQGRQRRSSDQPTALV